MCLCECIVVRLHDRAARYCSIWAIKPFLKNPLFKWLLILGFMLLTRACQKGNVWEYCKLCMCSIHHNYIFRPRKSKIKLSEHVQTNILTGTVIDLFSVSSGRKPIKSFYLGTCFFQSILRCFILLSNSRLLWAPCSQLSNYHSPLHKHTYASLILTQTADALLVFISTVN